MATYITDMDQGLLTHILGYIDIYDLVSFVGTNTKLHKIAYDERIITVLSNKYDIRGHSIITTFESLVKYCIARYHTKSSLLPHKELVRLAIENDYADMYVELSKLDMSLNIKGFNNIHKLTFYGCHNILSKMKFNYSQMVIDSSDIAEDIISKKIDDDINKDSPKPGYNYAYYTMVITYCILKNKLDLENIPYYLNKSNGGTIYSIAIKAKLNILLLQKASADEIVELLQSIVNIFGNLIRRYDILAIIYKYDRDDVLAITRPKYGAHFLYSFNNKSHKCAKYIINCNSVNTEDIYDAISQRFCEEHSGDITVKMLEIIKDYLTKQDIKLILPSTVKYNNVKCVSWLLDHPKAKHIKKYPDELDMNNISLPMKKIILNRFSTI